MLVEEKQTNNLKTEIKEGYGVDQNLISSFVWTNGKQNLRLLKDAYKTRDQNFKAIESKLGYKHENGEIQLKPLFVKISSTEK